MKIAFFGVDEQKKKDYFTSSLSGHEIIFPDQNLSEENMPQDTSSDIISVFVRSKVSSKVIDAFSDLKMIAIRATGFDNVDVSHAKEKNIVVSSVPAYGSHTVAEFAFGLILSLSRKIPQAISKVKTEGKFDHSGLKGFDLFGKTIGVIGTGKIGANVITMAKGFGMNVLAYDMHPNTQLTQEFDCHYVALDELLRQSDVITVHVPASPETHHLLNKDNFSLIKKGAILVNTARGDVIETAALQKALNEGRLAGAGLDVLEDENHPDQNLINSPSVIVTPHTAFYTDEAEQAIIQTTVENIQSFIANSPKNVVN